MARFTKGELQVMRILWEHGELKPAEIQERHPKPIKNSALRSYLTILLDKGHVSRRKVGKAYLYKAKTPRQRAFSTMLADLVETFCAGSVDELVMALVRKEKLSEEDLLELKRLADEGTGPGSQPGGSAPASAVGVHASACESNSGGRRAKSTPARFRTRGEKA